jgi:hypothetical protein
MTSSRRAIGQMVARPMRATPDDLHGNLFGRIPSPGTRPRDVFPRRRPRAACASCIFPANSVARCVTERTFTKLYTSLTALNIRTAIRVRPQLNPECRVSKAHRNILRCRLAERKTILAEIWRWLLKLNSKNYISISAFLSPWIQSGRAENVRIERDALLEDISIGGTG